MGCRILRVAFAATAMLSSMAGAAADANNPTCPSDLNWSTYRQMRFTFEQSSERRVLRAEGALDEDVPARLEAALAEHSPVDEIWIRSPGGHARAGNEAAAIRSRHPDPNPPGWACFGCNFMSWGALPVVARADNLSSHVHPLGDKDAIRAQIARHRQAIGLIGDVEQDSAMLASEDNDFLIRMAIAHNSYRRDLQARRSPAPRTSRRAAA